MTIGRDAEVAALCDFFDDLVGGDPHSLVLRGPAGVGKSHLLEHGIAATKDHDISVLRAAGHFNQGGIAYSGIADLLGDVGLDGLNLPAPQRLAIEVLLQRRTSKHPGDPLTVRAATRTVLAELSKSRAIVLAVDDLQWLDTQSIDALLFALPRLRLANRSAALLATWRIGEGSEDAFNSVFADPTVRELSVGPLPYADIATIVKLAAPGLEQADVHRRTELASGVPLFAVELARHNALGAGQALPASIDASFRRRLRTLSTEAQTTIGLCALSVSPTIAILMACLGKADVELSLDELARADLLTIVGSDIRLRHPLVAPAILGRLSVAEARRLREMLARNAPTRSESAYHLRALHVAPHGDTADAFVGASHEHSGRGAPSEAALLAETAVDYTPGDHPAREERICRALQLLVDALAGDRAVALLERVGPLGDPTAGWAQWAQGMAAFMAGQFEPAISHLSAVSATTTDRELVERAMADQAFMLVQLGRFPEAIAAAETALLAAVGLSDAVRSEALAVDIAVRSTVGLPWPAAQLDEALRLEDFDRRTQPYLRASGVAAVVAIYNDDLHGAESHLLRLVDRGAAAGPVGEQAWTSMFLAYARCRLGTLRLGDGLLSNQEEFTWVGSYADVFARIVNGLEPLSTVVDFLLMSESPAKSNVGLALNIIGGALVGEAEYPRLIRFAPYYWDQFASDAREPILYSWGVDLAEAYLAVGDTTQCLAVVDSLRTLTASAPRRSISAGIDRVEAQRCDYGGDLLGAVAHATAAVEGYRSLGWPVEVARSLLVRAHAANRQRQHRMASGDAVLAASLFSEAGFTAWKDAASLAVDRYARKHTTGTTRTAAQERVSELVLLGLSNNDIANRLHVSVKTVESHLTEIYRREGVTGRATFQARAHKPSAP